MKWFGVVQFLLWSRGLLVLQEGKKPLESILYSPWHEELGAALQQRLSRKKSKGSFSDKPWNPSLYFGSKANQIITLDNSDLACTVLLCSENVFTVVALNWYWIIVDHSQFEGHFFCLFIILIGSHYVLLDVWHMDCIAWCNPGNNNSNMN